MLVKYIMVDKLPPVKRTVNISETTKNKINDFIGRHNLYFSRSEFIRHAIMFKLNLILQDSMDETYIEPIRKNMKRFMEDYDSSPVVIKRFKEVMQ